MEPKQKISVSLELFNKMFGTLTQLPFKDVNGLIIEIQQEMAQTKAVTNTEQPTEK